MKTTLTESEQKNKFTQSERDSFEKQLFESFGTHMQLTDRLMAIEQEMTALNETVVEKQVDIKVTKSLRYSLKTILTETEQKNESIQFERDLFEEQLCESFSSGKQQMGEEPGAKAEDKIKVRSKGDEPEDFVQTNPTDADDKAEDISGQYENEDDKEAEDQGVQSAPLGSLNSKFLN